MANSTTFGGKIQLEGEKEYRKAISQIGSDLRVLGSEMGKVTAEFGKNDKSTESLTAANKVLTDQIDKQQQKVTLLRGALEQSAKDYGENDKKTQSWQVSLNKAEAELIKMGKELGENEKALEANESATGDAAKTLDEYGKEAADAGQKTLTFGDIIKANLTSEAIIGGIKALGNAIKGVADYVSGAVISAATYGDEFLALSTKTGVSTKTLQEFSAVSELMDVDLNTITSTLTKTTKSMSDAANGSKTATEAYSKLGVSVADSSGNLRDNEQVFWEAIDALGAMSNETERDAVAMQIFGKSAQELNPLIKTGSAGFADLSEKAHEMGLVMDDETLTSLGSLDDAMQTWNGTIKGLTNSLAANLAPELSNIVGAATSAAGAFGNLISSIGTNDGSFESNLENLTNSIGNFFQAFSESETTQKILGWGLILSGAIIALAPLISAAVSVLMAVATGAIAAWPIALGAALIGGLILFWPQISEFFVNLWSGLSEFFGNLWTNISGWFGEVWENIKNWFVETAINVSEKTKEFIDGIIKWFQELPGKIGEFFSNIWENIKNWFVNTAIDVSKKTEEFVEGFIKWFKELPGKIGEFFGNIWTNIKNWFVENATNLNNKTKEFIDGFMKWFQEIPDNIKNIGENLVKGLWEGIDGMINWVKEKITGFADSVMGWFKNLFGISSPSKLFRDQIGKNLALGLGEGFTDEMSIVSKQMTDAIPTSFDAEIIPNIDTDAVLPDASFAQNVNDPVYLVGMFQKALQGMAFEIDGDKMGQMVISKVERVVFT